MTADSSTPHTPAETDECEHRIWRCGDDGEFTCRDCGAEDGDDE